VRGAERPQPYLVEPIRPRTPREQGDPRVRQGSPRVFGWALVGIGVVTMLFALATLIPAYMTETLFGSGLSAGPGAVRTTGTVIDLQSVGPECSPIASFTVDGQTYTAISLVTTSPCGTALGRDVTVSYQPAEPGGSGVVVQNDGLSSLVSTGFVAAGVIFGIIGLALLVGGVSLIRRNPAAARE
jgi:hypothetical protein